MPKEPVTHKPKAEEKTEKQEKAEKLEEEKEAKEAIKDSLKKEELAEEKKEEKAEEKAEEKKEEKKQPVQKKGPKKTEAVVNGKSVPISTLDSMYICDFIRGKTIPKAIADLEDVLAFKRAIPMRGEIPHRKGKIMAGRYPLNAVKEFIKLLKSLQANSTMNGLENPAIAEAMANMAYRPFGRFGRVRRKRTHVKLRAVERKMLRKKMKKNKKRKGEKK
jgi:large subunit ribosomal protein L22